MAHVGQELALGSIRLLRLLFGLLEILFGDFPLSHFGFHGDVMDQSPLRIDDRLGVDLHPIGITVCAVVYELHAEAALPADAFAYGFDRFRIGPRALQEVTGLAMHHILQSMPGESGESVVGPLQLAVGIGDDDGIVRIQRHQRELAGEIFVEIVRNGRGVSTLDAHADRAGRNE